MDRPIIRFARIDGATTRLVKKTRQVSRVAAAGFDRNQASSRKASRAVISDFFFLYLFDNFYN
jgi:hypothetical protein